MSATDDRLTTNARPIDGALERLAHLRGIFYEYADDARENFGPGVCPADQRAGVSAQAIEAVFPQAVERSTFDAEENYLVARHDLLVPLLIEALHERGAIIAALERRVADLEYRVRQIRR